MCSYLHPIKDHFPRRIVPTKRYLSDELLASPIYHPLCFHNIAIEVVHLTKGQTEFFRLAVLNLGITIVHDICCGYLCK